LKPFATKPVNVITPLMNLIASFVACFFVSTGICVATEPVALGARRELFVDDHLFARMDGVTLKMHRPQAQEVALVCDAPWEGNTSGYFTFLQDGDLFPRHRVSETNLSTYEDTPPRPRRFCPVAAGIRRRVECRRLL
jgi:hypothetical protein